MNRAPYSIALCAGVLMGLLGCAEDAPPERYRSVEDANEEEGERHNAEPDLDVPICAEAYDYAATDAGACAQDVPRSNSLAPLDLDEVNVIVGPPSRRFAFPKVVGSDDCGSSRAWYFDDPDDPSQIVLCPDACEHATNDPDSSFRIVIGCGKTCYAGDGGCAFPLI